MPRYNNKAMKAMIERQQKIASRQFALTGDETCFPSLKLADVYRYPAVGPAKEPQAYTHERRFEKIEQSGAGAAAEPGRESEVRKPVLGVPVACYSFHPGHSPVGRLPTIVGSCDKAFKPKAAVPAEGDGKAAYDCYGPLWTEECV